jgi:hypothetical protein
VFIERVSCTKRTRDEGGGGRESIPHREARWWDNTKVLKMNASKFLSLQGRTEKKDEKLERRVKFQKQTVSE